ncbi:unnamed protein product [Brassicogethes aeneus]|uniref:RUS family member 1 n=1 Tax=Brassicogethes aeneus TaxID=1431903 RepID=A0A9P0B5V8_BRAAE|nr:unnamed protein product [Brassicogethes aeneus]
MSEDSIILHEKYGINGDTLYYKKGSNTIVCQKCNFSFQKLFLSVLNFFKQIVLPHGYPTSVSEDYLEYQLWDTVQAFCSTITNAFTTRAILKGMGVGNAEATALSATVAWILKDGTGMIGRILFAWWKGCDLDFDCKKWRFMADIINDMAMAIEIFIPIYFEYSMQILCVTSVLKSIVGVAGGATRASITHHQAIKENMAEISAIDGNQETLVNLVASMLSIFLLSVFDNRSMELVFIFALMSVHLLANYKAVKSIVFKKFNKQRLVILLKSYYNLGVILNPKPVNNMETVILGFGLNDVQFCGFEIKMGQSVKEMSKSYIPEELSQHLLNFEDKPYFILPNVKSGTIHVCFEKVESTKEIIEAYFYASLLAIAICWYYETDVDVIPKRYLHQTTPMSRLNTLMRSYERPPNDLYNIPISFHSTFRQFINSELKMFFTVLDLKEWDLKSSEICVGDYRTQWKMYLKKNV